LIFKSWSLCCISILVFRSN